MQGKNILLGVTASIAAYKAAILIRGLVQRGANVRVVMSPAARDFITPLTLATLCKSPILVDNFDPENGAWNSHISLGEWADHYIIAPATANTLAKMTTGIADNLLLCSYLSARCPVSVAPAMDYDMYLHPTTQANIERLRALGVGIIEPESGELASGLVGKGRMAEPQHIIDHLERHYFGAEACAKSSCEDGALKGKKVVITAGATIEPIDPVRYISNHSTGKMGYALADSMARHGAHVTLVSGAATASLSHPEGVTIVSATSADAMYNATLSHFAECDIAIFCAAVADYTPVHPATDKIKHKPAEGMTLELKPTRDIAAEMGRIKRPDQITVGFALETSPIQQASAEAHRKLTTKGLNAIVLNTTCESGAGFGVDTNRVTIIDPQGEHPYPLLSKNEVAEQITQYIATIKS